MKKKIVVIPGDGIGGEITDAAVKVLKRPQPSITWTFPLIKRWPVEPPMMPAGTLFPRKRWKQPKTPMRSFLVP